MTDARAHDLQMQALDPLAPVAHIENLAVEILGRISERALEPALKYQRTVPEFPFNRLLCVLSLIHLGRLQEARILAEAAPEEMAPTIAGSQCMFLKHALSGNRAATLTAVSETLKAAARRVEWWSLAMADCYALIHDKEQALDWLSNAIDRGFTNYPFLSKYTPFLPDFTATLALTRWYKKQSTNLIGLICESAHRVALDSRQVVRLFTRRLVPGDMASAGTTDLGKVVPLG